MVRDHLPSSAIDRRGVDTSAVAVVDCMWRKTIPQCIEFRNWPLFGHTAGSVCAYEESATSPMQFTGRRAAWQGGRDARISRNLGARVPCNDTLVDFPAVPIRRRSYTDCNPTVSSLESAQRTTVEAPSATTQRRQFSRRHLAPATDNDFDFICGWRKTNWRGKNRKRRYKFLLLFHSWLCLFCPAIWNTRKQAELGAYICWGHAAVISAGEARVSKILFVTSGLLFISRS